MEVVSERSGRVGASERRWGRGYGVRGADIVQAMGNPKRMQAQGRWGTEKYCILGVLEESGDLCQAFVSDKGRSLTGKRQEDWGCSLGVSEQSNW